MIDRPRVAAITLTLAVLVPSVARAATFTVTSSANAGAGSLRAALTSAGSGDTIVFDPSLAGALINLVTPDPRTLVGGSPLIPFGPTALVVDHVDVTIDGSSAPGVQIDGASTWRVFVVINGGHLTLRNVTVQNGRALGGAGGGYGGGGAGGFGGGVFVADGSALSLDGVTMLQNRALGGAGADGRGAGIAGNCGGGGGGLINAGAPAATTTLSGAGGDPNGGTASVDVGHAGGAGGGGSGGCTILDGGGHPLLEAGGNGGWGGGGGGGAFYAPGLVYRWDPGGVGGFGGGAGGNGCAASMTTVTQPTPSLGVWGGGVGGSSYCDTMTSNDHGGGGGGGAGLGGAVFVRGGTLDVVRSTLASNRSLGGAGGAGRAGSVFASTNGGPGVGTGAVFLLDATATIRESTLAGNVGGTVYVLRSSTATAASLTMGDSVLAGSAADCGIEAGGWFASLGNNLIQTNSTGANACTLGATDRAGVDPLLGALAANGGPTTTMLASPSSPLLGAGVCASGDVDQRGRLRSAAPACDIGAVELDRATVTLVRAGSGSGTVTSDVLGISCGVTCTSTRAPTPVAMSLTATPATGSTFTGYSGGGCGTGATCAVVASGNTSITATFDLVAADAGVDGAMMDGGVPDAAVADSSFADATTGDADASEAGAGDAAVPPDGLADAPVDAPTDVGLDATGNDAVPVGDSTITGTAQSCKVGADCASGFCVSGVCCDSACDQPCLSCTSASSPGRCTPVALGLDPKGDCAKGGQCLQTCNGAGACVTAFAGVQCQPSQCTGASTGQGPAYCAALGGPCKTEATVAFECAPYACSAPFGACLGACKTTDDCAPGDICDQSQCVAPPPDGGGGGCSTGQPARGAFAGAASVALLALALRARRRR